jgi:hypothetical protein
MGTPQWALEAKLAVEELHGKLQAERDKTRELQNRILRAMSLEAEFELNENYALELRDMTEAMGVHLSNDSWTTARLDAHPLALGTLILSAEGESDEEEIEVEVEDGPDYSDSRERFTGSMAVGQIISVDNYVEQGWSYGVVFGNGTWVHIDEAELADPDAYLIANAVF